MKTPPISTSNVRSSESARERLRLARRLFGELMPSYLDFHAQLERLLSSSSPGSQGVPSSLSPESPSQPT
jgi:hypothetical protein